MEVKVSVEGVPRVVCGVTEETTCQEVVVVLAQALGQPGRYMLREKFKDFERWMTPNERLLETLEKYGEQVREVQLTLLHNGPSVLDEMSRTKVDAGARMRRGSGSLSLNRQSLPLLPCSRQEVEQQAEDLKRPKRKSLTLMEEAWGWLENLDNLGRRSRSKVRGQKDLKSDLDNQTSCCMGSQTRSRGSKYCKKGQEAKSLGCLQDLQVQIVCIDKQIFELEEKQKAKIAEQESQQRLAEQEMEQIKFWENELKAEEGHEKHLESQFLEMREKAVECKAKLEEYKHKIQGLDFFATQNVVEEDSEMISSRDANQRRSDPAGDVNVNRKFLPTEDFNSPCGLVSPSHLKERRPTGPTELREWWTRWSESQNIQLQTKKVIHRSELTIYLGSTKV
uniref:Ras association domain-containing protein n=1 Tax=Scophthalmus maximus TaxID=52904 RepID=A0A8D3DJW4_SCOMX